MALCAVLALRLGDRRKLDSAEPTLAVPSEDAVVALADDPAGRTPVSLPEAGETSLLRIATRDEAGRPLPGVRLALRGQGTTVELGLSDSHGGCVHPAVPRPGDRILARRSGYQPEAFELDAGFDPRKVLEVVLVPAGTIRGRVLVDGERPAGGIVVAAWPDGCVPSQEELLAAAEGWPTRRVLTALCDPAGRFQIEGLDPRQSYTLAAAGAGTILRVRRSGVRAGTDDVELGVQPLYAVLWQVECDGGQAPNRSVTFTGGGVGRGFLDGFVDWEPLDLEIVPRLPVEVALLGSTFARERARLLDGSADREGRGLLLLAGPDGPGEVGPIRCTLMQPGYETEELEVWASSARQELVPTLVTLRPLSGGFGVVEVRCLVPDSLASGGARRLGALQLWDAERQMALELQLDRRFDAAQTFDGVPFGRYVAHFAAFDTHHVWPPADSELLSLDLGPAEPFARVTLDLRGFGAVRVEVRGSSGPYRGLLFVRLEGDLPDGRVFSSNLVELEGAADLLECVRPGSYRLRLHRIPGRDVSGIEPARIRVRAGEVTAVVFELGE